MTTATSDSRTATQTERSGKEKFLDQSFFWLTRLLALGVAVVLIWIAVQVGRNSIPAIREFGGEFLVNSAWNPVRDVYGILPMIYGTLLSSAIALLIAWPIGIASAIVLSENFLPLSIRTVLVFLVELLAAIPSVVYGLWGIYVLIPFLQPIGSWLYSNFSYIPLFSTPYIGPGMLPAGIILAIMILPIITAISRDSLVLAE